MKTTYLISQIQHDGTMCLSAATREEWLAIVEANKSLPADQQRYFIIDCIADGENTDRMVIETSAADYRKWNRERMAAARNRKIGQTYQTVSLDTPFSMKNDFLNLLDSIRSNDQVEEETCVRILAEELKTALAEWRPWANDLLECYLRGLQKNCTIILSKKYGVSPQVVRKYKRQFEEFVKNFLGWVSF